MKARGRLLVLSLAIAVISAAVSLRCDFDDDDCRYAAFVADAQNASGVLADKITPDRKKDGDDPAAPPRVRRQFGRRMGCRLADPSFGSRHAGPVAKARLVPALDDASAGLPRR